LKEALPREALGYAMSGSAWRRGSANVNGRDDVCDGCLSASGNDGHADDCLTLNGVDGCPANAIGYNGVCVANANVNDSFKIVI
jgi:hypothetical protein